MPATLVTAYKTAAGKVPIVEWLAELEDTDTNAYTKCLARILELSERGHELRRPHADILRDGVHELRASGTQYRILYFFYGRNVVALSHGVNKKGKVSPNDIELAIARMNEVLADHEAHIVEFNIDEE